MLVPFTRRIVAACLNSNKFSSALLGLVLTCPMSLHAQNATDGNIVFGQSAPLSGPAAQLGVDFNFGANLYFYEVNREGGVLGRKIELRILDDKYEPERTLENTRRLIQQDKVFGLMGYVGSSTSQAVLPLVTESGVPFLAAFTGSEALRTPFNPNVFNLRAGYVDETKAIVRHLSTLGIKRVAVFHEDDANGKTALDGVAQAVKSEGLTLVASGSVERNGIDVAKAVRDIAAAQPQAVVMMAAYSGSVAFIREMQKLESPPRFWNISFVGSQVLARELEELGRGVQISQVVPFPWNANNALVRNYQKVLAEVQGEPNFGSLEGYIAAKVVVEALRRSGSNVSRASFIKALESMQPYDMGGYSVRFSPRNHNGSHYVDLTMLSVGQKFIR
jgi:branched-chain amino acid transport system substrate-binding protein